MSEPPSVSLSFANNFWGKDDAGVGPMLDRMHYAKVTNDELKSFYAQRGAIEEEYARKLLNLSRKPLGSTETGTLKLSCDVLRAEVESMGKSHQNVAQQMKTELEEPLAAFAGGMKERRKIVQNGIEKVIKLKMQQTGTVNKARDRYEQDCLKIKGFLAQAHMVMGHEERKNKAKLEKTQINLTTTSSEYEAAVKILEETTVRWNRDWKAACDKFQDLEEERIDYTKSSLWNYANIASTVCVSDDASCEKMRLSLEDCDVEKDISSFIKDSGTGQEIPDAPKFINFCRGDAETSSVVSDDDNYCVAQFARTMNPAYRASSPPISVFESHHDPNNPLARELGLQQDTQPIVRDETSKRARKSIDQKRPPPEMQRHYTESPRHFMESPQPPMESLRRQHTEPVQQFAEHPRRYAESPQQYVEPQRQYKEPPQQYVEAPRQYQEPPQQYQDPPQQYVEPPRQYTEPPRQYAEPPQQYAEPMRRQPTEQLRQHIEAPQYPPEPSRQSTELSRQYTEPPQQYVEPPQQYTEPPQQYTEPPQQQIEPLRRQHTEPPQQQHIEPLRRQHTESPHPFVEPPRPFAESPRQSVELQRHRPEPPRPFVETPRQSGELQRHRPEPPRPFVESPRQSLELQRHRPEPPRPFVESPRQSVELQRHRPEPPQPVKPVQAPQPVQKAQPAPSRPASRGVQPDPRLLQAQQEANLQQQQSQVPHNDYPSDGMTQFCRIGPPSDRSTIPSPARPASVDSLSEHSNHTSFSSIEPPSGSASPGKPLAPQSPLPEPSPIEESSVQKKRSFFQNSPFRRKSKTEKDIPVVKPSTQNTKKDIPVVLKPSNRNTWAPTPRQTNNENISPTRPYSRGTRRTTTQEAPRTASPEPVDPRAQFQLNVGNNVFDVASPDGKKQEEQDEPQDELDPIAQALEELRGVTKQASTRVTADRYHGLATPKPPPTPAVGSSLAGSAPTPLAKLNVRAAKESTPPPSYEPPSPAQLPAALRPAPQRPAPKPSVSQRPILQRPVTKPLVVKPPVSKPLVPQSPVLQSPVLQSPTPQPLMPQLPVSQPRVAQPPALQPRVTQPPALQPRVTQPPALQPRVTQPPALQPQVPQSPARVTQPAALQPRVPQSPAPQPRVPQQTVPQSPISQPRVPPSLMPQSPISQPRVAQSTAPQSPAPQSPMSQPRMVQPPVSKPPVQQPPVSKPPVSKPPVSQPPVSQPSMSRLGAPKPAHTARQMQKTTQMYVNQTANVFKGNDSARPSTRGSTRQEEPPRAASPAPPRAASPAPPRALSPRPSLYTAPKQAPSRPTSQQMPSRTATQQGPSRTATQQGPSRAAQQQAPSPSTYHPVQQPQSPSTYRPASRQQQPSPAPAPTPAANFRTATSSPNPYAASNAGRPRAQTNGSTSSQAYGTPMGRNSYSSARAPSPSVNSTPTPRAPSPQPPSQPTFASSRPASRAAPSSRAVSPQPQFRQSHERPSTRGSERSMNMAPSERGEGSVFGGGSVHGGSIYGGSSRGRPQSVYQGAGGSSAASVRAESRTRSKSLAEPKNYNTDGRIILNYSRAMYSYTAQIPEELGFMKGDILAVLRLQDDGWWEAEAVGKTGRPGLVPSNYLQAC